MAVITPFKLDHVPAIGKRSRHADGRHGGLRPGTDKAQFFHRGHGPNHQLCQVSLRGGRRTEACPPFRSLLNRLHYQRVGMAEDHRPPGAEVVQVAIAIGVPKVGSFGSLQERWISPDGAEGAYRRIYATGQILFRALLQFLGTVEFSAHGIQYRGPCLGSEDHVKRAIPGDRFHPIATPHPNLNLEEPCQNRRENRTSLPPPTPRPAWTFRRATARSSAASIWRRKPSINRCWETLVASAASSASTLPNTPSPSWFRVRTASAPN